LGRQLTRYRRLIANDDACAFPLVCHIDSTPYPSIPLGFFVPSLSPINPSAKEESMETKAIPTHDEIRSTFAEVREQLECRHQTTPASLWPSAGETMHLAARTCITRRSSVHLNSDIETFEHFTGKAIQPEDDVPVLGDEIEMEDIERSL
jgi:hypothetical protein